MKAILIFSVLSIHLMCIAQKKLPSSGNEDTEGSALSDSIKKYFNYDTLRNFSCQEVRTGIYALSFKVGKEQKLYAIDFSDESLPALNNLITAALQKAFKSIGFTSGEKRYLQLVYFNNILGCNNSSDTLLSESKPIATQQLQLFVRQLMLVEKTFNSIKSEQECIVLKPVTIDDNNPNRPRSTKTFCNDQIREVSQEFLEKTSKEIEKKKKKKFQ